MDNDLATHQTSEIKDSSRDQSSTRYNHTLWLAIIGFMFLSTAIGALQRIPQAFANNIYQSTFIENWLSWISVLFFALGWFVTHWAEIALQKTQRNLARFLLIGVIIIGSLSISIYFRFVMNNDIFQRFSSASQWLIYSAFFLRYSLYSRESLGLAAKVFWGIKY